VAAAVADSRKPRREPLATTPPAASDAGGAGGGAAPASPQLVEERGLPLVRELARIARNSEAPIVKLEGALEVLFGAFGEADHEFSGLVLTGWMRAREEKQSRLTMAWLREQLRLSVEDIVAEGMAAGVVRRDLDAGAVAAVILGAADGCLLQTASHGGPVPPAVVLGTLLRLLVTPPAELGRTAPSSALSGA
jgi:hypothetical protein